MKKTFIALTLAAALFAADEFTPPKPRFMPEEAKTSRWLLSADFLYWTAEMEGLQYATRTVPDFQTQINPVTNTTSIVPYNRPKRTRSLRGDWEPGLRVSTGYLFDEKGWDLVMNWSYFRTEPSEKLVKKGEDRRVIPFYLPTTNFYTSSKEVDVAKAKWTHLQLSAEIEAGKNFPVGKTFLARPFFGLKGISLKNKTLFEYTLNNPLFTAKTKVPTKSNFIGAGPRVGGNVAYEFGKGLGIFFLGSGSLLYGNFDASFNGVKERKPAITKVEDKEAKVPTPHFVTAMQVQLGGQWTRAIGKKYHFALQAAWEQNFYSNVNQIVNHFVQHKEQTTPFDDGDLSLKGLTASCHLDF
ncbi:MAG: hypothetical protein K1X28_03790 [Parachlamydiales bacterium]|nr:hypothetical protein [Parachlamydiales bacterium]